MPERFELGTLPYELLAGTTAAVDFLADLVPGDGDRRTRLVASMGALEDYEAGLFDKLLDGLGALDGVTLHGSPAPAPRRRCSASPDAARRRCTSGSPSPGSTPPGGNFYALEASRWLGLGDDGAVRAGLAPYTDESDIDRLLTAVADCATA